MNIAIVMVCFFLIQFKMSNEDLISIGFETIKHFTITNSVIYDLGRNRHLSAGCVGEPNEMIWICYMEDRDSEHIDDLVCVHNYDYDGLISLEKVKLLITALTGRVF